MEPGRLSLCAASHVAQDPVHWATPRHRRQQGVLACCQVGDELPRQANWGRLATGDGPEARGRAREQRGHPSGSSSQLRHDKGGSVQAKIYGMKVLISLCAPATLISLPLGAEPQHSTKAGGDDTGVGTRDTATRRILAV